MLEGLRYTGKMAGVIYDPFGDFEGFMLLTLNGHDHWFRSHEDEIEELVHRAWLERIVVRVYPDAHDSHWPKSIALLRHPPERGR